MKLYTYYRSSASFRVRIALNLKKLSAEYHYVDLSTGRQYAPDFMKISPQSLVPVLVDKDVVITQSMAIIEYLEEVYPDFPLLPSDRMVRAHIRSFVQAIACEMQPFGNVRALHYLKDHCALSGEALEAWKKHWVILGLSALEESLKCNNNKTVFAFTNTPSLAEVCLIPQMMNAERFGVDITQYQKLYAIYQACLLLPAFIQASPAQQQDNQHAA